MNFIHLAFLFLFLSLQLFMEIITSKVTRSQGGSRRKETWKKFFTCLVWDFKVFNDWFWEWELHQEIQDNIINFVQKKTSFKRIHLYICPLLAPQFKWEKDLIPFFQEGIDCFFHDSLFFPQEEICKQQEIYKYTCKILNLNYFGNKNFTTITLQFSSIIIPPWDKEKEKEEGTSFEMIILNNRILNAKKLQYLQIPKPKNK